MNIVIIGTGYVGLVTGSCFSEMGINVSCVDTDKIKIQKLNNGIIPIYEPGLEELVKKNYKAKRLNFTTDLKNCLKNEVKIIFIAVETPPDKFGNADLHSILSVARTIGKNINNYVLVVIKSTVPVGTSRDIKIIIQNELDNRCVNILFDVAVNPEFLKEGSAIKDFMSPDRIVIGVENGTARKIIDKLYKPFTLNCYRMIYTDIFSAEMIKYATNAMLATRISFMNDIANLCSLVGADIDMVRSGIGFDSRIGTKFLYPGCGYGGSCFSKDIKALIQIGKKSGYSMQILKAVENVNKKQKTILFDKLIRIFKNDLKGKIITLWGLSFKPNTNDIREAPSLAIINLLLKKGVILQVYDPVAMNEVKKKFGNELRYFENMYDAVNDASALLLLTEWKEFRLPCFKLLKKMMRHAIILDGRNIYDKKEMQLNGFTYIHI
ncbi:MAG: UDP-glucose/GDP-mannose dehydrogenase family protein [Bacteroidales bacterium OttesenSCG-928-I14]|jgi:UDPglucose 6-dehydrogenase|nr:UDP-glucose/GDP-mannose dehydrogenase family protein [Bacteroidales bacterium OttesenSCG-928-I14]